MDIVRSTFWAVMRREGSEYRMLFRRETKGEPKAVGIM